MSLHRLFSYSLMTAGALVSAKSLLSRWQWEDNNIFAAIMLDWDDVHAVATRAAALSVQVNGGENVLAQLLLRYKESGATHLSLPELTLARLLAKGELSVAQGDSPDRVYLQAQTGALARLVVTELQARLPHLEAEYKGVKKPLISFKGDLPTVAEVGLGFNPAHAELVRQAGLAAVARPVGYSWVQPEMIDRTLDQAAGLGVKIIAVQGTLTPGFEFKINHTVEAMRRNRLTYAYFNISRHQRGDWFLAKNLAEDGLVILAHEFEPAELLEEDWFTVSDRWANLATEAGIRLCSVRFFRVIHAADPLESLAYIQALAKALAQAGLILGPAGAVDLTPFQPRRDTMSLVGAGLSTAGAAGLAADLFPLPDPFKLAGAGLTALALTSLPFLEKKGGNGHHHGHDHSHSHHNHDHDHDDHEHEHHDHPHDHGHAHHDHEDHPHDHSHDHGHHHHGPDRLRATAYAPKGIALASSVAYPAAAAAINGADPIAALTHALVVGAAGATALSATATEADYVMGVEGFRGYNLDWLLPVSLAAVAAFTDRSRNLWKWIPLLGAALAGLRTFAGGGQDLLAGFDREHRHSHTHHLSAFQSALGDTKMALSPKPLRKWSLLAPLGVVSAAILKRNGQKEWAAVALATAAAGQVATLTGFRNGQRSLAKTAEGRARGWMVGLILAGLVWLIAWLWNQAAGDKQ